MFYYTKGFVCEVNNFDPAPILLAEGKVTWDDGLPGIGSPVVSVNFDERNWWNLVSWLHMCHRGKIIGWDAEVQGNDEAEDKLLQGLFDVAIESSFYCPTTLDFVINSMRPAMVELHEDWAKD